MQTLSAQQVTDLIRQGLPVAQDTGFFVQQVALPQVTCCLPYQADQIRPGNTLSGPTLMTLADATMYALILALDPTQLMAVTHDLHIHFLARPAPQDLTATATLLKAGKRSVVMRVDIWSGEKLVAHATGSYAWTPTVP